MTHASEFNAGLLDFLARSPTPFHATANLAALLAAAGFKALVETADWALKPGGRYYCIRNDASLIAFVLGTEALARHGIRMLGSHTDSPCLMVRPHPEKNRRGYFQLGVEVYGGALLNPWFDRDLSLAGRVVVRDPSGRLRSHLVDFRRPLAVIPSLAIHLDREANRNRSINAETDIQPLLGQLVGDATGDLRLLLAQELAVNGAAVGEVLDFELCLYDTQPPARIGLGGEFIAAARLDNLLSCYVGVRALLASQGNETRLVVCSDHEEVGSASASGAQGPFLESVLMRLLPDATERTRALMASLLISADNAHGVHPNFPARHDDNHGPLLNRGPVLKVNTNQRYATNSVTAARLRQWARDADVPLQTFVARNDMGCGSTIGPLTAARIGVPTLDLGVPTLAMHSIRELAGAADAESLFTLATRCFNHSGSLAVD
ncbi:MAG: M18 family aminopeptidase [Gammaproteobacteria bacterium]|nr:M18 family aminopeptidase [Gammaproteobacteria bacterium]MBK8132874.1 M18 family aminopeptidase [Gammaproteobacteria bacterium]MBK9428660.1 M18 family aminopeptidase [Gammaproteobacteria bacterium]